MYPKVQTKVYTTNDDTDAELPSLPPLGSLFPYLKVTVILLNAIAALVVAILAIVWLLMLLFVSFSYFVPLIFLSYVLVFTLLFAYFFTGLYGALKENERVFLVYLLVTLLVALACSVFTVYLLMVAGVRFSKRRRDWEGRSWALEYTLSPGEVYGPFWETVLGISLPMMGSITWSAFLLVFARSLRQWNGQMKMQKKMIMGGRF